MRSVTGVAFAVLAVLAGCGGGAAVVVSGPGPEPEPTVQKRTPQQRAEARRAEKRKKCKQIRDVGLEAVEAKLFDAAYAASKALLDQNCDWARTGGFRTRLMLGVEQELSERPSAADTKIVATEWAGCLPRTRGVEQCAANLRQMCPKPKQSGPHSRRIVAYTRVALQTLRGTPHAKLWIAAQGCVSHTLGVTLASSKAIAKAGEWHRTKNRAALTSCLANCGLSEYARQRIGELQKTIPETNLIPLQDPKLRFHRLVLKLRQVNRRARRAVRARRFSKSLGGRLFVRGNALVAQLQILLRQRRKDLPRAARYRFKAELRTWKRRKRGLRRRLR